MPNNNRPTASLNEHGQIYLLEDKVASHFAEEDRIVGPRMNRIEDLPNPQMNATGNVRFVDEADHKRS